MTARDAKRALESCVDMVWVSSHGNRPSTAPKPAAFSLAEAHTVLRTEFPLPIGTNDCQWALSRDGRCAVPMRASKATDKAEDMVLEEHHVVDLVLAELPKLDPSDERFEAKMTVLSEMVEHHADQEEEEMFPIAERKLGEERLRDLGQEMDALAQQLKED